MGRHRWTSRLTVEDCRIALSVASFCRSGVFASPPGTLGWVSWTDSSGAEEGRIDYRLTENGLSGLELYVCNRYGLDGVAQTIRFTTVLPYLGGKRYWFLCACGHRVGRLYLGQQGFRCRHCYRLTYKTAQTHDPRESFLARNHAALIAALKSTNWRRIALGLRAVRLRHRCPRLA